MIRALGLEDAELVSLRVGEHLEWQLVRPTVYR